MGVQNLSQNLMQSQLFSSSNVHSGFGGPSLTSADLALLEAAGDDCQLVADSLAASS